MTVARLRLGEVEPIDLSTRGEAGFHLTGALSIAAIEITGRSIERLPRARWPIDRRSLRSQ